MKEVDKFLDAARHTLDKQVSCHTPEYHVLDQLHRAITALADEARRYFHTHAELPSNAEADATARKEASDE